MSLQAPAPKLHPHTVQMTTGEYGFHKVSQFLLGGSMRLISLQQAMQAGVRLSEVALRHIEFAKAITFGTRPMTLVKDGQVPNGLVDIGNQVLSHFNYRTFEKISSLSLLNETLPFAMTAIITWELGAYFFGKPSPLYNVVSVLPINVRFQSLQSMVAKHGGLKKAASAWLDRALGRGEYQGGTSSAKELKAEMTRKFGENATEINTLIDTAEQARPKEANSQAGSADANNQMMGQKLSSKGFNFLFGGSLRLVALQQTLQATLRISEVALRGVDMGKYLLFGERAMSISANSGLPSFITETANTLINQYSFRSFTEMGIPQLLTETAPFAITAVALWELSNFLFGAPSPLYNIVSILPVNVRKDTLVDMIYRHNGLVPASKALVDRILEKGDFSNDTRSIPEIKQDLLKKYGQKAANPIIIALDKQKKENKKD